MQSIRGCYSNATKPQSSAFLPNVIHFKNCESSLTMTLHNFWNQFGKSFPFYIKQTIKMKVILFKKAKNASSLPNYRASSDQSEWLICAAFITPKVLFSNKWMDSMPDLLKHFSSDIWLLTFLRHLMINHICLGIIANLYIKSINWWRYYSRYAHSCSLEMRCLKIQTSIH